MKVNTTSLLPLENYDTIIVSFSGGKDSVFLALDMKERLEAAGLPLSRLQLWHQHVDGEPSKDVPFMDWPCTESYCRAFAKHLGVRILFQWRHGGFRREMLKDNDRSAPVSFDRQDGSTGTAGGIKGKISTRRKFPQVSANLAVRWCSASLKIDTAALALNNEPAFKNSTILFLTGERREESAARSQYAELETHRCSTRSRRVDGWRSAIDQSERQVWAMMEKHNINPHPAYFLGWSRVSCLACIFGMADQWASVRAIAPDLFDRLAAYEREFGCTIKKGQSVVQQADNGKPFSQCSDRDLVNLALSRNYPESYIAVPAGQWRLPPGAFRQCGGPI